MLKGAFIFVIPGADSKKQRATVETPNLSVIMVGTKDFDDAANTAKSLVSDGIQLIELCGGFGPVGTAKIIEAVGDKIPVGGVYWGPESRERISALLKEL